MLKDARKIGAVKRIEKKRHAKARQKKPDDPASGLQGDDDQDRPGDDVVGFGLAPSLHEADGKPKRVVERHPDDSDDKAKIDDTNTPRRGFIRSSEAKEDEDQREPEIKR